MSCSTPPSPFPGHRWSSLTVLCGTRCYRLWQDPIQELQQLAENNIIMTARTVYLALLRVKVLLEMVGLQPPWCEPMHMAPPKPCVLQRSKETRTPETGGEIV